MPAQLLICAIVRAELFFGAVKISYPLETLASKRQFIYLFSRLTSIDPYDLHIAALAL